MVDLVIEPLFIAWTLSYLYLNCRGYFTQLGSTGPTVIVPLVGLIVVVCRTVEKI